MGTCWKCGDKTDSVLCNNCSKIFHQEKEIVTNIIIEIIELIKEPEKWDERIDKEIVTVRFDRINQLFIKIISYIENTTIYKLTSNHEPNERFLFFILTIGFEKFMQKDPERTLDFYIDIFKISEKYGSFSDWDYNYKTQQDKEFHEGWYKFLITLINKSIDHLRFKDSLHMAYVYCKYADSGDYTLFDEVFTSGFISSQFKVVEDRFRGNKKLLEIYDAEYRKEKKEKLELKNTNKELKEYIDLLKKSVIDNPSESSELNKLRDISNKLEPVIKRDLDSFINSFEKRNYPACEKTARPLFEKICHDICKKECLDNPNHPEWDELFKKNKLQDWRNSGKSYGPELFLKITILSHHFKKPEYKTLQFKERKVAETLSDYVQILNPEQHTGSNLPINHNKLITDIGFVLGWYFEYLKWKSR